MNKIAETLLKTGSALRRPTSILLICGMLLTSYGDSFVNVYADQTGESIETTENTETEAQTETISGTVTETTETETTETETTETEVGETETEVTETENASTEIASTDTETADTETADTELEESETIETETVDTELAETEIDTQENNEDDEDGLLTDGVGLFGLFKLGSEAHTTEYDNMKTTLSGAVAYSGDTNWSTVTRPENYDVSKFALYAYATVDGELMAFPLEIQNTDISGNVYLQFYDSDGVGNFTIKSIPKTIVYDDVDYAVESYKLAVEGLPYYIDTEATAAPSSGETTAETLVLGTLTSAADVCTLTLNNTLKGGLDGALTAKYTVTVALADASKSNSFSYSQTIPANTAGDSIGTSTLELPKGLSANIIMNSSSIAACSYAVGETAGTVSDGVTFTPTDGTYTLDVTSVKFTGELGWTLRYVDNITSSRSASPQFTIYYSLDGGSTWIELSSDSSAEGYYGNLLLGALPSAVCNNSSATNSYIYEVDGLPTYALTSSGEAVEVMYKVETSISSSDTYLTELLSGDYMSQDAIVLAKLVLDYSAEISWADASRTDARPDIDTVKSLMHMYSFCDGVYEDITDTAGISLSVSDSDDSIWNIETENLLPKYDSDSNSISYFVIVGTLETSGTDAGSITEGTVPVSDGVENTLSYVTSYDNGGSTFGNIFDRAYNGGKIINTIYDEIDYSAEIVWNDKSGAIRPSATVSLMRYSMTDENDTVITAEKLANAAAVVINDSTSGNQTILSYTLNTSGKTYNPTGTDSDSVTTQNTETLDFVSNCSGSQTVVLPKYDGNGYEYCYFVVESFEDDDSATSYTITYEDASGNTTYDSQGTSYAIKGGVGQTAIKNDMDSRVAIKVNKTWYAKSALNDLENITLSYKLIVTDDEGKYHLMDATEGYDSMTGFGDVYTKSTVFVADLNDGNGGYYVPYAVMESVTNGSSAVDVTYTDLDDTDDVVIAESGTYVIGSNTYTIACNASGSVSTSEDYDGIPLYTYNVTNIVSDNDDYTVAKRWGRGYEMHVLEEGEEVELTSSNKGDVTYVDDNASDVKALDFTITGTPEKGSEVVKYYVHMNIDENYRPTTATFSDSDGNEIDTVDISLSYSDTDSTDEEYKYYETWKADFSSVLPAYTSSGYKYVYTIVENTTGNWNYTNISYSGTKATIVNQIHQGTTNYIWVTCVKKWKDDGNTDNRSEAELHAYVMDDEGNYVDLTTVAGEMPTFIEKWLLANYTEEEVTTFKEQWDGGAFTFKVTLTAAVNWNGNITLPSYLKDYVSDYDGTSRLGIYEAKVGDDEVVYENGNYTLDGSVHNGKYSYTTESTGELIYPGTNIVTNTRYGTVDLKLIENWYDGGDANDTRPEYIDVLMTRNKGEDDEVSYYLRQYFDTSDSKVKVKVYDSSMNEITDTDTLEADGIYMPEYSGTESVASDVVSGTDSEYWESESIKLEKYDSAGTIYTYDFEGVTSGDNWTLSSAFATKTSAYYKHFGSSTSIEVSASTSNDNLDCYTFEWSHRITGSKTNSTQIEWRDTSSNASARPDVYLTLYRTIDDGSTTEYTTYDDDYTITWTGADYDSDGYHLLAQIKNLPAFDSNGYEYLYYVVERLGDTAASTSATYTKHYYYCDSTSGTDEWLDKAEKNDYDSTDFTDNSAGDGERIVNVIGAYITFSFEKIWSGVDGFAASELPTLLLTLQQRVSGSTTLNDYTVDSQAVTYTLLPGETKVDFDNLPTYNNSGVAYEYRVREEYAESDTKNTVLSDLYTNILGTDSITNTFVSASDGNKRSITVYKYWDLDDLYSDREEGDEPAAELKYATAEFRLFRVRKDLIDSLDIASMIEDGTSSRYYLTSETITGGASVADSVTFDDLMIYSPNGTLYYYIVSEVVPDGYTAEYYSNQAETEYESTVTGIDENGDSYTRTGSIIADNSDGYIIFKDEIGLTDEESSKVSVASLRNIYYTHLTTEKIRNITGTKTWRDYNNAYEFRPEDITLKLYRSASATSGADNAVTSVQVPFVVKTEEDDSYVLPYLVWSKGDTPETADTWSYTFYNLRKTSANGNTYTYEVREEYNSSVNSDISSYYYNGTESYHFAKTSANSFSTITNGFTKTFTLQKNWMDGNNKYGFRPDAMKIRLQYRVVGGDDDDWENAAHYYVGSTEYDYSADTSDEGAALVVAAVDTASNQSVVFKELPKYIYDSVNGYREIEYRVYEDAIGYLKSDGTYTWSVYEAESTDPDSYIRAGSYVRETITETDGSKTVLNNSLISNAMTITLNWENDSENTYQTRPESVRLYLQYVKVNDDATVNYSDTTGFAWENVTDSSGNDVVITMQSSDSYDTTTWKKTVKSLAASDETNEYTLFYRAVQVTDGNSHPVTVVSGVEKTYMNYEETSDYDGSTTSGTLSKNYALDGTTSGACQGTWEYLSNAGINYVTLTNKLVSDTYTQNVKGIKNWHKDETSEAEFELKYRLSGETAYSSFATPIKTTLTSTGADQAEQSFEWTNLPAMDSDGNTLEYTVVETDPEAVDYYVVEGETSTETTDENTLEKTTEYSFDNVGTFDYTVTKTWENNYYGFPATVGGYTGFSAEVALLKSTDGTNWEPATDSSGNNLTATLTDQTATTFDTDGNVSSAGTDRYTFEAVKQYEKNSLGDYDYLYYKTVETKINGVITADGRTYLYPTASADEVSKAYNVSYVNDYNTDGASKSHGSLTEITNTLVVTEITVQKEWDDNSLSNATDVERADAFSDIDFKLYASTDGTAYGDTSSTAEEQLASRYQIDWDDTTLSTDTWSGTIEGANTYTKESQTVHYGLPRYAADQLTEITYSVKESVSETADEDEQDDFLRYVASYQVTQNTPDPDTNTGYTVVTVTNTLSLRLDIVKEDENDSSMLLAGTTFALYKANYDSATGEYEATGVAVTDSSQTAVTATTDANGKASIVVNEAGYYELKETQSSTGYSDSEMFDAFFTVTDEGLRRNVTVTSALIGGTDGVSFTENTTDSHLSSTGVTNVRKLGTVSLYKKDGDKTDKTIDDVTFTLYKKDTSTGIFGTIWNFITGNRYAYTESVATVEESTDGVTVIDDIPWGSYKIVESATVDGYKVDSTPYYFEVNADTVSSELKLYSDVELLTEKEGSAIYNYKTSVTFKKYNSDGSTALTGGKFEIREAGSGDAVSFYLNADETGGTVNSFEMTADGVTVYGLKAETNYALHEVLPPTGYKNVDEDVAFNIAGADNNYDIYKGTSTSVKFTNNIVTMNDDPVSIAIKKVDSENGTNISGAEFAITGMFVGDTEARTITGLTVSNFAGTMENLFIATEDANGTEGVDKFTYVLKESSPADGYSMPTDSEGFSFIIDVDGEIVSAKTQASVDGTDSYVTWDNTSDTPAITWADDRSKVDIDVKKVFDETFTDGTDEYSGIWKDDIRPDSITLALYKKTASMSEAQSMGSSYVHTFDTSDTNTSIYTYTYENLPLYEYTVSGDTTTTEKITYSLVEESVPKNYGVTYTTVDNETATSEATKVTVSATNTNVQEMMYLSADNVTLNDEKNTEDADKLTNAGGTITIGSIENTNSIDEIKDVYTLSWKPATNWMSDDGFTITYLNWDAKSTGDTDTVTVDGMFDTDGSLITDTTASCYAELLAVYPYFEISEDTDGTITLCLDGRSDKSTYSVPYKSRVDVTFTATTQIKNVSGIPSEGAVSVDGSTYTQLAAPGDSERTANNVLYARATAGCYVALDKIRLELAGEVSSSSTPLTESELVQEDSETYTFKKTVGTYAIPETGGVDGYYDVSGTIKVLDTDEYGNATLVSIEFTEEPVPVDVGVVFINNTSNTYSLIKYWRNESNTAAYDVTFELQYKKGDGDWQSFSPAKTYSVSKDEPIDSEAWTYYWTGLETYELDTTTNESTSINYRIVESGSDSGYVLETEETKSGLETTFIFANIELMDYTVTKSWAENVDTLSSGSEYTAEGVLCRSIDGGNTWSEVDGKTWSLTWSDYSETTAASNAKSYTFTDLPKYLMDGTKILYRAKETKINGNDVASYDKYNTEYSYPDNYNTNITNTFKWACIHVIKTDADGDDAVMSNVSFTLYETSLDASGERVRGDAVEDINSQYTSTLATDANGELTFMVGDTGVYELVETAPTGYENYSAYVEITDSDMQATKDVEVHNKRKTSRLIIRKIDGDTDEAIEGVTFALYKKDDTDNIFKKAFNFITGNTYKLETKVERSTNGATTINNLTWGDYYIIEETTADGYVLTSDKYTFSVTADNAGNDIVLSSAASSLGTDNTISNYKNNFTFIEKSVTGTNITGGSYVIYKKGTTEKVKFALSANSTDKGADAFEVTDTSGITIYGIPSGSYVIHETGAPVNYESTKDISFYMSEDGKVYDEKGGYLITSPSTNTLVMYDMPVCELEVTKLFVGDNDRDDASYTDWTNSLRGEYIKLQLTRTYNNGLTDVTENVGETVNVNINAYNETFTYIFENLKKYIELSDGSYEQISYAAKEVDADIDFYTVTESSVTAVSTALNQESETMEYEETITNSAVYYQTGAYLEIAKTNEGGPTSAVFKFAVNFGVSEGSLNKTFKDGYEVYEYDTTTGARGALIRTESASDGYMEIKGSEMAVIKLPKNVYYEVDEKQSDPPQYEETENYSDSNRQATEDAIDRYDIINKAILYTGIENSTVVSSVDSGSSGGTQRSAGGTVGVVTSTVNEDASVPTAYDKEDYVEGAIRVYWKNDDNWMYGDSFTIKYRDYDDPANSVESDTENVITVDGYIDSDGNLVTDKTASCYDELRAVYPNFDIYMNSQGAIVLHLAESDDGVPYANEIVVSFVPTIAVINITDDDVGGRVKVDGGTYRSDGDGNGSNGESRYINKTKLYAKATDGYMLDLSNVKIGEAGCSFSDSSLKKNLLKSASSNNSNNESTDEKNVTAIELDSNKSFSEYLNSSVAGESGTYEVDGNIIVTETDAYGNPTAIEIDLSSLPIPLDVGIKFTATATVTDGSSTDGGTSTGDDTETENGSETENTSEDDTENDTENESESESEGDTEDTNKPNVTDGDGGTGSISAENDDSDVNNVTKTGNAKTGDFDKTLPVSAAAFLISLIVILYIIGRNRKNKMK
ncbi:MAG: Cna B-type domain-containing protein [Lachnospiraceae bacterium]|nr:Cna B-type domain-containing protein [Lachnospiraceae bacterium]